MDHAFLVATDMDYTLLLPGMPVSDKNREAIRAIRDLGGEITLSTGRSSFLTGIYTEDLDIRIPIITSNGAAVFDPVTRREIYSSLIPQEKAEKLARLFLDKDLDVTAYSPEGLILFPGSTRGDFINRYNEGLPDRIKAVVKPLGDDLPPINKFLVIAPDEKTADMLRQDEDLEVMFSASDFLDVMRAGNTKGFGLRLVREAVLGDKGLTFALGDGENDLSMIREADHGIAMKGSSEDLLREADYVTTRDCGEDGFAEAVFDYIIPTVKRSLRSSC